MIDRAYHATTQRQLQLIWDGGESLNPSFSERHEAVFVFETIPQALDFIARYPGNFTDTGAVILELDVSGLKLVPDFKKPPLEGAWRSAEIIALSRFRAEINPATGGRLEYPEQP
jgi:hypothetical protein